MSNIDPLADALQEKKRDKRNGSLAAFASRGILKESNENGSKRKNNYMTSEDAAAISQYIAPKKRRYDKYETTGGNETLKKRKRPCSFCQMESAAVSIKKSLTSTELCLLHYYTTRAVLGNKVSIYNKTAFREQLPFVQSLYERAMAGLIPMLQHEEINPQKTKQKKLRNKCISFPEEKSVSPKKSIGKVVKNTDDVLANLLKQTSKKENSPKQSNTDLSKEGGFIRTCNDSATERKLMQQLAAISSSNGHKSIWNLALDKSIKSNLSQSQSIINDHFVKNIKCTCGSTKVESQGNITGRNNDVHKAEIWGIKRDNDVVTTRLRCLECGRIWNEED